MVHRLVDTDKNYGPADFDDSRFTVRWAYNGDNHAAMARNQTWGWGAYEPAPVLSEFYTRITRAYARLRSETLVKGEYYRYETNTIFPGSQLRLRYTIRDAP
ncbi:MAG: hypothetical protein ABSH34_11065 [Verrucomicrobiota bacterium]